jgi:hypothetical protein
VRAFEVPLTSDIHSRERSISPGLKGSRSGFAAAYLESHRWKYGWCLKDSWDL